MESFTFWQRWLYGVALTIVIFGLLLAFFNQTLPFDLLLNNQLNRVFWDDVSAPVVVADFQSWVYGVLGATMAGWGVFLAFIACFPFRDKARWAWDCVLTGLLLWYIVDSGISLHYGAVFNALFNTVFLVAGILPLLFTRREFAR